MYLDYSNTNIPQPDKFSIERRSALSEKKPSIPRNQGLKCLALAMFILISNVVMSVSMCGKNRSLF